MGRNAIDLFNRRDIRKRGQVEFIRVREYNLYDAFFAGK